jgi:hypothetical protein
LLPFSGQSGGFHGSPQAATGSARGPKKIHREKKEEEFSANLEEENPGEEDPLPDRQFCFHSVSTMTPKFLSN